MTAAAIATTGRRDWLAAARALTDRTQETFAQYLGVSTKTVSQWERGVAMPKVEIRGDLAEALGFTRVELARKLGIAAVPDPAEVADTNGATPFERTTGWLPTFVRAEQSAYVIWTLVAYTFPALTQTADYARAVEMSCHRPTTDAEVDHMVRMRLDRAPVLGTATYVAIVPAHLLDATVGGHAVMAEQLAHLLALADRANITVLVIDPEHLVAAPGPFTLLATCGPVPDIATEIGLKGAHSHEGPIDAADWVALFDHLVGLARSPEASRVAIAKAADRFADLAAMTKGTTR